MPSVVIGTQVLGYDGGVPSDNIIFSIGSADYAVLFQLNVSNGGDGKLHVFKRLSGANTWAEKDSGHAVHADTVPYLPSPAGFVQYCVWHDGATIFLLILKQTGTLGPPNTIDGWDIFSFNTASDTWNNAGAPVASYVNGAAISVDYLYGTSGGVDQNSILTFINVFVRGTGDYIFYYSGTTEVVGGNKYGRLYYSTFNGTTFGTSTLLPGQAGIAEHFIGIGGVCDSTGTSHLIYADTVIHQNVYHVGLSSLNVFGTKQTVNATNPDDLYWNGQILQAIGSISQPIVYTNSASAEVIAVAGEFFHEPFNINIQDLLVFVAAVDLNPIWTTTVVTSGTDDSSGSTPSSSNSNLFPVVQDLVGTPQQAVCLATDGSGNLTLVWCLTTRNTFLGHVFGATSANDGGTWTLFSGNLIDALDLESNDNSMVSVYAYQACDGIVGVIGNQASIGNFSEATQWPVSSFPPPPPPTCSLTAFPTSINIGDSSLLSWTTTHNPTSGVIDNGVGAAIMPSGAAVVAPTVTTTYHLLVTNSAGSSTCQATVNVTSPTTPVIPANTPCARKIDCVIQLYKHPLDAIDMTLNWDGWLEAGDAIATSAWASDVGLTLGTNTITGNTTAVRVSGGTDTFAYLLRNIVTTAFGLTELRSAAVNVLACHTDPPDPYMRATDEDIFFFIKNPLANVDISIDWSGWLGNDTIANFSFVPVAGITATFLQYSLTATSARVTGGVAGTDYLIEHMIQTALGRTGVRHIVVEVRSCS